MAVNFTTDGRYTTIMDAKMYVYSMYTRIALEIKPVLLTHRGASTELEEQQPHDHRRGAGLESQDTGGKLIYMAGKAKSLGACTMLFYFCAKRPVLRFLWLQRNLQKSEEMIPPRFF